jgi:hypothetical protein
MPTARGGTLRRVPPWVSFLVPLVSALLGAVVGGFVVHRLTLARDARNTQRALRVEHLVSSWGRLSEASNRESLSAEHAKGLEGAISDVMLLGDRAEVDAAREFIVEFARSGRGDLERLLTALRSSLRRELNLSDDPLPAPYSVRVKQSPDAKRRKDVARHLG